MLVISPFTSCQRTREYLYNLDIEGVMMDFLMTKTQVILRE